MMKTRIGIFFSLMIIGSFLPYTNAGVCTLDKREAKKKFPNIWNYTALSYELSVEYSLPKMGQYDFAKEYYSNTESIGRVEFYSNGTNTIHYYSEDTNEGFNIADNKCESMEVTGIAEYRKELMTEWFYEKKPFVFGPSAMLLNAQDAFKIDTKQLKTGYMGETKDPIRGFKAEYWRRCSGKLQFDYYFSTEDNPDIFNSEKLQILNVMPLRVNITHNEANEEYPQTYDIINFQPYLSDLTKLEVPIGFGCNRGEEVDKPTMPDFMDKNFIVYGEAVYKDPTDEIQTNDYVSSFSLAITVNTNYMAFFYTPWKKAVKGNETEPDGFKHEIYDMKHKYLYTNDIYNDKCTISRQSTYFPYYVFPDGNGYISLTDPAVLFSNDLFSYIANARDRNMEVRTYEGIFEDLPLGNRSVSKAIVTKNFLKNGIEENTAEIKDALSSININLYNKDDKKENELNFNFYGFTTIIPYEDKVFDVSPCFKKTDQSIDITIGFTTDPATMAKMNDFFPEIEQEFRRTIEEFSEVNSLRMPTVLVDFESEESMLYITFMILDKPPAIYDYLEPEVGVTIVSDRDVEGMQDANGCAFDCLENVNDCWGFSICGTSCYFGTENNQKIVSDSNCQLYRRSNNYTVLQTKETIRNELKKRVSRGEFLLSVGTADAGPPIVLKASYFTNSTPGESDELSKTIGETSSRLRIVKVGSKLNPEAGETVKNLGNMPYDKCQSLCLDYKACETVSYCLKGSCILSTTYGEEIPNSQIIKDNLCSILTRTYADQFVRTPGLILSQLALKTVNVHSEEECAKACAKETSFLCQSFDNCRTSASKPCRLHAVHYLDFANQETAVEKEATCGHYSRKFNYGFKKESFTRVTNPLSFAAVNITLEQCAKLCFELMTGTCHGYDYCEDELHRSSTCTLLNMVPSEMKTVYSPICHHFLPVVMSAPASISKSTAAWAGILTFVIAAVVGAGATFGIGYWRANRSR